MQPIYVMPVEEFEGRYYVDYQVADLNGHRWQSKAFKDRSAAYRYQLELHERAKLFV